MVEVANVVERRMMVMIVKEEEEFGGGGGEIEVEMVKLREMRERGVVVFVVVE